MVMAQQTGNRVALVAVAHTPSLVLLLVALELLDKVTLVETVAPEALFLLAAVAVALAQQVRRGRHKSAALVARVWRPLFQAHPLHTQAAAGVPTSLALAGQPQAAQAAVELAARTAQV